MGWPRKLNKIHKMKNKNFFKNIIFQSLVKFLKNRFDLIELHATCLLCLKFIKKGHIKKMQKGTCSVTAFSLFRN